MLTFILLILILSAFSVPSSSTSPNATTGQHRLLIWPLPASLSYGYNTLTLSDKFQFLASGDAHSSPTLSEAFQRYLQIIFQNSSSYGNAEQDSSVLQSLIIDLESSDELLNFGKDESYSLSVPDSNYPTSAYLKAKTVYGALRGLETFSQLCVLNYITRTVQIPQSPWKIEDYPRFPYRGLLIDTSRHYQPVKVIKNVIDAMSYAKLNVLHWHIVDTQSFPLEIPSFPKLWDGAYSPEERYTFNDAQDIVQYAQKRGINIMAEIDIPGHAASWGVGYPELWPSPNCTQPLDVSRSFTFDVIQGIVSDFAKLFDFNFLHIGGDEVNTSCWSQSPHIKHWLEVNNLTEFDAYKQFVLKAESVALSHGFRPVNWEEPFDKFGNELNKKTIIHNWLQGGVAPSIVKAGFECIVSNQDVWYLDHLNVTWEQFYMNEPLTNISDPYQQKLVIGGEVCMWGETVDASDIQQTIWPRAAAAAERLWSPVGRSKDDVEEALPRLEYFRCLLNQRGIGAAPVLGVGRSAPLQPGSCYSQ